MLTSSRVGFLFVAGMLFNLNLNCAAMTPERLRPASPAINIPGRQSVCVDDSGDAFFKDLSPKTKMNLLRSFSGVLITEDFPITFLIAAENILYTPYLLSKPEAVGAIKTFVKLLMTLDERMSGREGAIRFFIAKKIIETSRFCLKSEMFLSDELEQVSSYLEEYDLASLFDLNFEALPNLTELVSVGACDKIQLLFACLDSKTRKNLINQRYNGNTLLHTAVISNKDVANVVRLLIFIGLDPNTENGDEKSCYALASFCQYSLTAVMREAKIEVDTARKMFQGAMSIFG